MIRIPAWNPPPKVLSPPAPGQLHLWLIDLTSESKGAGDHLSSDERARAKRMLSDKDRRRFSLARGDMRMIIGSYLGLHPASMQFRYGSLGKPEIQSPATELQFNLSHSGDLALLAVTFGSPAGIDLEPVRTRSNARGIAGKVFSGKVREYLSNLEDTEFETAFLQQWTLLEARVKVEGKGVFSQPGEDIRAVNFQPKSGWIAAVGMRGKPPKAEEWLTWEFSG